MPEDREDQTIYSVVISQDEQYSIWPAHKELASGWKRVGKSGTKAECLAYIKEVWKDKRPRPARRKTEKP
jgi:MbtH protein